MIMRGKYRFLSRKILEERKACPKYQTIIKKVAVITLGYSHATNHHMELNTWIKEAKFREGEL